MKLGFYGHEIQTPGNKLCKSMWNWHGHLWLNPFGYNLSIPQEINSDISLLAKPHMVSLHNKPVQFNMNEI